MSDPDDDSVACLQGPLSSNEDVLQRLARLRKDRVRELYLQQNRLEELPDLCDFIVLEQLFVWSNLLDRVPPSVFRAGLLTHLDLDSNLLTRVPREIGRCVNLQVLLLSNNLLQCLPSCISQFAKLERLYLQRNDDLRPATLQRNAASRKTVLALQKSFQASTLESTIAAKLAMP
jgi:Leucine-rich repeat (LRR) protein